MKKRIGRRQLIENLRMARRQREEAVFWQKSFEDEAGRLREQNREWRERLERLENDPGLQYQGTIQGGTLVKTARIDFRTVERIKNGSTPEWSHVRHALALKMAEAIIEEGLMRVEYGGEIDYCNTREEPYDTVRVIARLDVVPWDRMVRRTVNGLFTMPRDVPPVYEDMIRNEGLAPDAPRPWE